MTTTRITRLRDGDPMIVDHYDVDAKGGERFVGTDYLPSLEERAEHAALEERRDVLRAQLDPNSADPAPKALADAQAFLALAADVGVAEAAVVAGVTLDVEAVAVDPKGIRNA